MTSLRLLTFCWRRQCTFLYSWNFGVRAFSCCSTQNIFISFFFFLSRRVWLTAFASSEILFPAVCVCDGLATCLGCISCELWDGLQQTPMTSNGHNAGWERRGNEWLSMRSNTSILYSWLPLFSCFFFSSPIVRPINTQTAQRREKINKVNHMLNWLLC